MLRTRQKQQDTKRDICMKDLLDEKTAQRFCKRDGALDYKGGLNMKLCRNTNDRYQCTKSRGDESQGYLGDDKGKKDSLRNENFNSKCERRYY